MKTCSRENTDYHHLNCQYCKEDAPQEKQCIIGGINGGEPCLDCTQPTSETYDQGAYIIVQDGDDEAFKNGNYYTAHLYFNSVQEWEIKEEYNTYLVR